MMPGMIVPNPELRIAIRDKDSNTKRMMITILQIFKNLLYKTVILNPRPLYDLSYSLLLSRINCQSKATITTLPFSFPDLLMTTLVYF